MTNKHDLLKMVEQNIRSCDAESAVRTARAIVDSSLDVMEAMDVASAAIKEVGDRFQSGEIYLPELMLGGKTMQEFLRILSPHVRSMKGKDLENKATVVICTVSGDIHDIGKNLVSTMLSVNRFKVVDLGVNISPMNIVDAAERENAQIIAISSLMTTSMPAQRDVLQLLVEMGLRDRFFVAIGGGPVTQEFAKEIGVDGWGLNAASAVRLCDQLAEPGLISPLDTPLLEE